MLRTNTALWRIAFLSGLGVLPNACGGHTDEATDPVGADTNGGIGAPSGTTTTSSTHNGTVPLPTGTGCVDSVPYLYNGVATGLERCSDGRLHRPAAIECSSKLPRSQSSNSEVVPGARDACASDSDCTEKPLGHCDRRDDPGGPPSGLQCEYGCVEDSDCGTGYVCQCGDPVGACVAANCQSDSDCGPGLLCARDAGNRNACSTQYQFFCEKPDDACRIDADCVPAAHGSYCTATTSARVCAADYSSICGRPFLVEGSARLAGVECSSAWLVADRSSPDCSHLSAPERAELARAWSQLGLMEHASVAAFARFTLQLLSVGAPAALLEQSQQALADELLHARLCFGLASAYAGEPIGPGVLATEHALDLTSLEDIAALTLHEGCVGETLAAIEASEALALAQDPAVRATLARIQADERRHAELGWRFVTWAIRTGGTSVQRRIQHELATLVAHAPGATTANTDDGRSFDTSPHGILSARHCAELRAAALRDVVLPCAQALLPATDIDIDASARCAA